MTLLLPFAATLFVASLLSGLAQRTVISTAVLFLVVGFVLGAPVLGVLDIQPDDALLSWLAELALFAVLFGDGMRTGIHDLVQAWRLPGRTLFLGLPLALGLTTVLGRILLGLEWAAAVLLAATLSPTDPVFAEAIVGSKSVPYRLRHLLNVESGLNDGLALPLVIVALDTLRLDSTSWGGSLGRLALGVAVGVVVPGVALGLQRSSALARSERYQPLGTVALGLLVLALGLRTQANLFLAAFTAGVVIVSIDPDALKAFRPFGEVTTELLKLLALLAFGALISLEVVGNEFALAEYAFVLLTLAATRPLALFIALYGAGLKRHEWLAVAWFGPKGFASMVYGLLILKSGVDQGAYLFHLIALIVGLSIVAHSSTDVVVARWFDREDEKAAGLTSSAAG